MTKNKRNQSGFTLIEVLLSMAMLMVVVVPLLSYFSNNAKYNQQSKKYQRAITVGEEVMEEVKSFATIQSLTDYYVGVGTSYSGIPSDDKAYLDAAGNPVAATSYTFADQNKYVYRKEGITSDNGTYNAVITVDTYTNKNYRNSNAAGTVAITSLTPSNTAVAKDEDFILNNAVQHFKNCGGTGTTEVDVKNNLNKKYLIEINGSRKDIATAKKYVTIKIIVNYTCGLSGCAGQIYTATLYNGMEIEEDMLTGIYMFYNYEYLASTDDAIQVKFSNYSDGTAVDAPKLKLYAICQDLTDEEKELPGNSVNFSTVSASGGFSIDKICSNVKGILNGSNPIVAKTMENMVGTIPVQRIADITVQIYPVENGIPASEAKVTLHSTRGE